MLGLRVPNNKEKQGEKEGLESDKRVMEEYQVKKKK